MGTEQKASRSPWSEKGVDVSRFPFARYSRNKSTRAHKREFRHHKTDRARNNKQLDGNQKHSSSCIAKAAYTDDGYTKRSAASPATLHISTQPRGCHRLQAATSISLALLGLETIATAFAWYKATFDFGLPAKHFKLKLASKLQQLRVGIRLYTCRDNNATDLLLRQNLG